MRLTAPSAVSKSCSPWRVVSDGDAALLLLAVAGGAIGSGCLSGRHLSPCRLPSWILGSPLSLKPPSVCIHRYGEYEVGLVQTRRRPERYRHLRLLPHAWRKLLRLIHQHGCGDLPPGGEGRQSDEQAPPQVAGSTQYGA